MEVSTICYHITATLAPGANLEAIQQIFERNDLAVTPTNNPHITQKLPPDTIYFLTTKHHCDCDSVLGYTSTKVIRHAILHSKKYRNLQRKGWSAPKLQAWIDDKIAKETKKRANHGRRYSPVEREQRTTRWVNLIRETLHSGSTTQLGLLKHWYHGNIETEEFTLTATQQIPLSQLTPPFLLQIDEDVLYLFTP